MLADDVAQVLVTPIFHITESFLNKFIFITHKIDTFWIYALSRALNRTDSDRS